jgi:hypothetical protein
MAGNLTFLAWLLRQHARADAIGDLARFAARDPAFPRSAGTKAAYQRYLDQQVVPWQIQIGLRQGWQEWQQAQPE